jgi:phage-related minor tail protein
VGAQRKLRRARRAVRALYQAGELTPEQAVAALDGEKRRLRGEGPRPAPESAE